MSNTNPTETLSSLIASCETEARANGLTGEGWEPTATDLEWVTDQLGRKPSREEWTEAGYPHVGGAHVADKAITGATAKEL